MLKNISIEEANKIIEEQKIELELIERSILDSFDHVLGEDIRSNMNMPPFDRSPLDGYAYRAEDTLEARDDNPISLGVIDYVPAGHLSSKTIGKGQAMKIMTGSKIPKGADVVMRYEDTKFTDSEVTIFQSLRSGSNVVSMGEDMKEGDLVLEKGTLIGPAEIGIMATLGKSIVKVYKKPKIAIIATGDELINIDGELTEGKIRNSNSYTVAAQVKRLGGDPLILPICKDGIEETKNRLKSALRWADMVITTGGVSVGDADLVKEAFQELGADMLFWRVKMKPGTPIVLANYENKLLFGLSGNPAASYITFEQFVRPTILRLMGRSKTRLMEVESILESDFLKTSGQNRYVRAFTYKEDGKYYTRLPDKHSSGVISSLSGSNSIFHIPSRKGPYKKGDNILVELLVYLEVEK